MSLKKITITSTQTTSIPESYGKSGTTGANAGEAQTTESNSDDSSENGITGLAGFDNLTDRKISESIGGLFSKGG